jgi:hypothetical protein
MVQGHHDEADQQISTLLARRPEFHPTHALRLFSAFLRLAAFLKDRMGRRFAEVFLPSNFPLPPPDPTSPGIVRWVIDEGVAHFRRLPDKAFSRDALLAATFFLTTPSLSKFVCSSRDWTIAERTRTRMRLKQVWKDLQSGLPTTSPITCVSVGSPSDSPVISLSRRQWRIGDNPS